MNNISSYKTYVPCHRLSTFITLLMLLFGAGTTAVAQKPNLSLPINKQLLDNVRQAYRSGDKATAKRIADMAAYAEKYLKNKPVSVTDKKIIAPSNDPRDYITLSPYWWSDSTKKDGLPYVRRDGKRNPEVYEYANREQGNYVGSSVDYLSILYYVTGEKRYAKACAAQMRAWFTDEKRGINPNMTYSQIVPGRTNLRGTGIIDSRRFVSAILMSQLIEGSGEWTQKDINTLKAWVGAYCYWLENSTQGRKESKAVNNHGLWYDAIHIMLLAYLDRKADVENALNNGIIAKLNDQIAADGSLPQELRRTLSLHYSTFVLDALIETAHVVRPLGINLWTQKTAKGTGMTDIVNFLQPFYLNPQTWQHKQIKPFETERGMVVLREAAMNTGNKDYLRAAERVEVNGNSKTIYALLYGIGK